MGRAVWEASTHAVSIRASGAPCYIFILLRSAIVPWCVITVLGRQGLEEHPASLMLCTACSIGARCGVCVCVRARVCDGEKQGRGGEAPRRCNYQIINEQ